MQKVYLGNILLNSQSLKMGSEGVNIYLGESTFLLPDGYTQLEYIESTGTQRINPNLSGNARWIITAQSTATSTSTLYVLLSSSSNGSAGTWYGNAQGMWGFGNNNKSSISQNTKATADITFNSTGVSGTVNGETISRIVTISQGSWRLFRTTGGGDKFIGRLFEASVYQDDVLVSKLIPAKQNSDGEIGLYDTVRNIFFTNDGTGNFIAGPVILPDEYTKLEYIKNSIGAWIDTGIMPSNDMIFETKIDFDTSKIADDFFSSLRQDTGNTRYYLLNFNQNYAFAVCNTTWPGVTILKTQVTAPYEIKSHIEQTKVTLQVNDVVKSLGSNLAVLPNHTLPLFAGITTISTAQSVKNPAYQIKCYYARYIDNGELVRDFIPCRRKSDNKVGMYDSVTGEFFTSVSTNNFIGSDE